MADKKKMSVAEILAAARKADGGGGGGAQPAEEPPAPADAPSEEGGQKAAAAKPAAKPAKSGSGGRPSVAEMMAMARAEKQQGAKPAAEKPKPAAKAKPAAKPAEKKPAKAAPAAAAAPKDTASILAAARKEHKPGPMSKSEAAAKGVAVKPAKPKAVVPPMPPKPAYAKPAPKPKAQVDSGRRLAVLSMIVGSFLALGFSSLAATFALWTLGFARFMFPNILREPPSQFKVGFPGDFAPGTVETKFKAQFGVWVVNWEYNGQPQIYALQSVCTHLGCTPNWLEAEQKFKCPCHGSGFYKDGINFEGPAPRPLERFAIRIADDGQLEIDKSKTFQEEMGEWEDPASYVAV